MFLVDLKAATLSDTESTSVKLVLSLATKVSIVLYTYNRVKVD